MEKQKEVVKELVKMKIALENLSRAFSECEEAFESDTFDCNDFILGSKETEDTYPFQHSFDVMACMVDSWVSDCTEKIDKQLKTPSRTNF